MFRIGQGFDVHSIADARRLVLGGVDIPSEFGLLGHSDADVLVHSMMDAIIGALALGDIGTWFPDTDSRYKDANSLELLSSIMHDKRLSGWRIENIDSVIIAQKPRLAPYIGSMRKNIATVLNLGQDCISVKATTTEKLGFCGRGEGIAATAIVLMIKE